MKTPSRFAGLLSVSVSAALMPGVVTAQTASPDGVRVGALEEVIVTAQRREQSLQEVPIAVSALAGGSLEAFGIDDSVDLAAAVPGLNFQKSANGGVPFIRGIGNSNVAVGDESAVAIYVDGVYVPSTIGGLFSLSNIAQVEVLKGPQGTLFGRNAMGGVIQITTRKPTQEPTYEISAGYGNYKTHEVSAYGSTGLAENIAGDLAIFYKKREEGWGRNTALNREVYESTEFSARTKVEWQVSPSTTITFAGDYTDAEDDLEYLLLPGSVALDGTTTYQGHDRVTSTYPAGAETELWGGSITVDHDLGWANLVSITSYRNIDGYFTPDNDATALPILNAALTQAQQTYAQELRIGSTGDAAVDWLTGIYLLHSEGGYEPIDLGGAAVAPASFLLVDAQQTTVSYAAFAQATIPVTDRLGLTLGLRYTVDEQEIDYWQATDFGATSGKAKEDFSELTPRVSLEYQINPDLLVYASYNKGFKSGLFNTVTPTDPPVRPATVDAYEVGLKTEFLDGRVRFNSSAFYYDQQDLQLLQVQGPLTIVVNAAESEVLGADFELDVVLSPQVSLRAGATVLDSEYKKYDSAPITTPNPAGGNIIVSGDASGLDSVRSPDFQGNIGLVYEPTENWAFSVAYSYTDPFAWDPDNRLKQPSHELLNANVRWTSSDERFGVKLWVRNALDEEYYTFASASAFGDIANPAEPATYGISFTLKH